MKEQVLKLRKEGKSYREIAKIVGLGKTTVERYCNPKNAGQQQRRWRKKRRKLLLMESGGKCQICGYNKSSSALDFHHLDPDKKKFSIARGNTDGKSMTELQNEIKKCILVCSNCHHEIHDGIIGPIVKENDVCLSSISS